MWCWGGSGPCLAGDFAPLGINSAQVILRSRCCSFPLPPPLPLPHASFCTQCVVAPQETKRRWSPWQIKAEWTLLGSCAVYASQVWTILLEIAWSSGFAFKGRLNFFFRHKIYCCFGKNFMQCCTEWRSFCKTLNKWSCLHFSKAQCSHIKNLNLVKQTWKCTNAMGNNQKKLYLNCICEVLSQQPKVPLTVSKHVESMCFLLVKRK